MITAAPELARDEPAADSDVDRPTERGWPRIAVLVLCVGILIYASLRVAVHDPTELQVSGDQASFVLQAVSIGGGDLSYDERDHARWLELGWEPQARGLFLQRNDHGWAFAKPYGYSLLLAPPVTWFGADGISYVNAGLLLAYAWCWYAIGRARWRPMGAALVATSATVASNAWPMAFPAHADLFVAVVVGVFAVAAVRLLLGRPRARVADILTPAPLGPVWTVVWACVAAGAAGVLVTEKMPALVAIGPLLALALWRSPWRARLAAAAVAVVVVGVSLVPYLHYSDGETWNAYGGDRYYTPGSAPWSGGLEENLRPWETRDDMSPGRVVDRLVNPSEDIPSAALTYVIGRHTGAVTNQPIIGALGVATLYAVVRRRRGSRSDDDEDEATGAAGDGEPARRSFTWSKATLIAAGLGLVGYVSLYLIAFTDNYFGGGQSVGNRYFLQISVLVAVIPVAGRISTKAAAWSAVIGAALAYAVIHPHLVGADDAFFYLERTSWLQDELPFEHSQSGNWRFQCGAEDPCFPGNTPVDDG